MDKINNIRYAMLTDKGTRKENEDTVGVLEGKEGSYFFLADGLGGHGCGNIASGCVVNVGKEIMAKGASTKDTIGIIFSEAQKRLLDMQEENIAQRGMKTTFNIVLVEGSEIKWGHIGDSRTYRFTKNLMGVKWSRTRDHSVPQMLAGMGKIKEKQIRHHEDRNRLLKAMGAEWKGIDYEIEKNVSTQEPQAFLMCSDGFWELIEEKEMVRTLKKAESPEEWLKQMEKEVIKNGTGKSMDNYSAVAVWINW